MLNIHASAVSWQNQGIIIMGPSGSGKSDLCLRLIVEHGARLVSDDRCEIELKADRPTVFAPQNIKGKLEVRGVGIAAISSADSAPLCLAVQIVPPQEEIERFPLGQNYQILGKTLPLIKIHAFEASAPAKILMALKINSGCDEKEVAC